MLIKGPDNCIDDRGVGTQEMMLCNEICFVEESVSIDSNLFISEASLHLNQNKYVNLSGGKRISTNKI